MMKTLKPHSVKSVRKEGNHFSRVDVHGLRRLSLAARCYATNSKFDIYNWEIVTYNKITEVDVSSFHDKVGKPFIIMSDERKYFTNSLGYNGFFDQLKSLCCFCCRSISY